MSNEWNTVNKIVKKMSTSSLLDAVIYNVIQSTFCSMCPGEVH